MTRTARRRGAILLASFALIAIGLAAQHAYGDLGVAFWAWVAAVVAGVGIARRAIAGLRRRDVTIELLVSVAVVGALAIGEAWEAAAVTFLFTLGAYLEARHLRRRRSARRCRRR